jgi:hypothetical protein
MPHHLEADESVVVEELHLATGWSLRRFNPTLSFVVSHVDERRVFQSRSDDYPHGGFFLTDEERVILSSSNEDEAYSATMISEKRVMLTQTNPLEINACLRSDT